jgi:Glyoxalase-like domain
MTGRPAASAPRGLDHLVLAVADLAVAGEHYGRMGFQVGPLNVHPWGTRNRLVQFPGVFLELIASGEGTSPVPPPGTFSFAFFVRDFIARHGEGFAMLVLESRDAEADRLAFDAAGIGGFAPFFFDRRGKRPDGSDARVAFTMAFAAAPEIARAGFFACQHHEPQNFWAASLQRHENGAETIKGVTLLAERPARHIPFLEAFSAAAVVCAGERNVAVTTPRGAIEIMTPACFRDVLGIEPGIDLEEGPRLAALKVRAPVDGAARRLGDASIPFHRGKRHLAVAASDNHGVALVFEG